MALVSFATILRIYRESRSMTQQELASATSTVSLRALSDLERGVAATARVATARQLVDALQIDGAERDAFLLAARGYPIPVPTALRRDNLPTQEPPILGRDDALAALHDLIDHARIITLAGPGAIGKTQLAIALAHERIGKQQDGVWLVDLHEVTTPQGVREAIVEAVGNLRADEQTPGGAILTWAAKTDALLILDGCELIYQECAALARTLLEVGPKIRILVTSRRPLGLAKERVWRVPPLALPPAEAATLEAIRASPAVQLLIERAHTLVLTEQNARTIATIVRRLDGLPLAIELAAARLETLDLDDFVSRLDRRFALLTASRGGEQSLRETIARSYDLLSADEQVTLRRLGAFASTFTGKAAEAVVALDDDTRRAFGATHGGAPTLMAREAVIPHLASLVEQSLILSEKQASGAIRYRLLETIREFAREQGEATTDTSLADWQHCRWAIALAGRIASPLDGGPATEQWLRRIDAEIDNIRAALHWAKTHDRGVGLQLVGTIWPYWFIRLGQAEGRAWLAEFVAATEGEEIDRLRARHGLGFLAVFDELATAHEHLAAVHDGALCLGDVPLLRAVRWELAFVRLMRGQIDDAERLLDTGWEMVKGHDHPGSRTPYRMVRGSIAIARNDLDRGGEELAAAYSDAIAAGQLVFQCMILARLGETSLKRGKPAQAAAEYEAMLQAAERLGSTFYRIIGLYRRGMVHEWAEELSAARQRYAAALELARTTEGNRLERGTSLLGLARVALYENAPTIAHGHLQEAAVIFTEMRHPLLQRDLTYLLGQTFWQLGQRAAGRIHLRQSLDLRTKLGDPVALLHYIDGVTSLAASRCAECALRWRGAVDAMREARRLPRPQIEETMANRWLAMLPQEQAGEFASEQRRIGRSLPIDAVVDEIRAWLAAD